MTESDEHLGQVTPSGHRMSSDSIEALGVVEEILDIDHRSTPRNWEDRSSERGERFDRLDRLKRLGVRFVPPPWNPPCAIFNSNSRKTRDGLDDR
jgi:hypothetical protein